jgi:hypothetical protein
MRYARWQKSTLDYSHPALLQIETRISAMSPYRFVSGLKFEILFPNLHSVPNAAVYEGPAATAPPSKSAWI